MVALASYAVLVLVMWLPFSLYSGLPAETGFVYTSETGSVLGGFLYQFDPLRIHTKTFYHLPYLIGEMFGVSGSYVPFQIVHAVLWWARGALLFVITRRLVLNSLVAYVAGAILLVHSSDRATQWIGQLNQFGFIFWTLLACYLLIVATDLSGPVLSIFMTALACLSEYMSLWSYESAILLVLLFPLAVCVRRRSTSALAWRFAPWYAIAGVYIWMTIARYEAVGSFAYQASVIRREWSAARLLADWWFNVQASLSFWTWDDAASSSPGGTHALAWTAAAVFVLGGAAIMRSSTARDTSVRTAALSAQSTGAFLFGAGVIALVFSFPVYLLLDSAVSLWRTQFLSGAGTGLVLAAVTFVASYACCTRPIGRATVFIATTAVVVWFGSGAAIHKGAAQRLVWERHRAVMAKILAVAPSVKPDTIIVVINVLREKDPFTHHMWCDLATRLAYPGIPVAATYFYTDGTRSSGSNLRMQGDRWKWDGTGFPPVVRDAGIANTLIVDVSSSTQPLVREVPKDVCDADCETSLYNPGVVVTGPVSPVAVRRYRLDAQFAVLSD